MVVTILGDLLDFGQLFKVCGNNYLPQIAYILGNFCKGVKIYHFSSEIIFGQLFRQLATFYWLGLLFRTSDFAFLDFIHTHL